MRNPDLENAYEASKKLIANECPGKDPNERFLYHGTGMITQKVLWKKVTTIDIFLILVFMVILSESILFLNQLFFLLITGHGAYFADNPAKSHGYTKTNGSGGTTRIMFYNKVTLGIPEILNATNTTLRSSKSWLSFSTRYSANPMTEYIVYTNTQALPFLKITYDTGM